MGASPGGRSLRGRKNLWGTRLLRTIGTDRRTPRSLPFSDKTLGVTLASGKLKGSFSSSLNHY